MQGAGNIFLGTAFDDSNASLTYGSRLQPCFCLHDPLRYQLFGIKWQLALNTKISFVHSYIHLISERFITRYF